MLYYAAIRKCTDVYYIYIYNDVQNHSFVSNDNHLYYYSSFELTEYKYITFFIVNPIICHYILFLYAN